MTGQAHTEPAHVRLASTASDLGDGISAEEALRRPPGPGFARFSVVSDKFAADSRRPLWESASNLLAGDLMSSPVITAQAAELVSSVARLMLESGIRGVPVLDARGRPVGMVSDGDLLGRRGEARHSPWLEMLAKRTPPPNRAPERPVGEVMTAPLITVSRKTSVRDIAKAFQAHRIKRLPVLDGEDLVGVVTRADLLCLLESLPAASPVRQEDGGGLLSFLESLIGGASLRGGLERPSVAVQAPTGEEHAAPQEFSAEAFRDAVRASRAESRDDRQALEREAQLRREQQVKDLLDQHASDSQWSDMLDRAKRAASAGEQEFMMLRFPSDLCSDGGRKIDVAEEGWEGTLRGAAAELYSRWRTDLKPRGFGLSARIVSYEDGIIGDIGLFLTWRGD